jgi:glycine cleavage system aminomethyltransferase T
VSRIILDGAPIGFEPGETLAIAIARVGQHPQHGGTLCLAGDCGNCSAEVDGISWVRTCQTRARAGAIVNRHPRVGAPSLYGSPPPDARVAEDHLVEHRHVDVALIGSRSTTGTAEVELLRAAGRDVLSLDATDGQEVVAIYAGPRVIVRNGDAMMHVHAHEVVIATGAAELHPVCPGNQLRGLLTAKAATALRAAGIDLGRTLIVGSTTPTAQARAIDVSGTLIVGRGAHSDAVPSTPAPGTHESGAPIVRPGSQSEASPGTLVHGTPLPGTLVRFDGTTEGNVSAVVMRNDDGTKTTHECDTVVLALGTAPRDMLARMADDPNVRVIGPAAASHKLPLVPTEGVACPCSGITVEDWQGAWDRGFNELELMKRASLTGTGTCQGGACLPHLQAFVSAQKNDGTVAAPFTSRPASRQITLGEASAGVHIDAWRRTPLHDEHLTLGAAMDRFGGWWRPWNYGDHVAEYWAVREGVSIGDVSTLGKMVIHGPDAVEVLERLYPTTIADIKPGRSRYVLILNERGHLFDDGMVCRETDDRFVLTFTSGGASSAEAWVRDWVDTWGLDVRLMDRTMSLAAINVTGPLGAELLHRVGLTDVPKFLQHRHELVAGIPCHVMRLSFTGEASWELHHPWDRSAELWRALMDAGHDLGIKPHGLQALFGLRLEKGHVLVGMDTELDTTPKRIAHDWAVKMNKPFFLGQEALQRTAKLPDQRRMIGLRIDGPAPTEGMPILADAAAHGTEKGEILGHISTSFFSPLLGHSIALGWLKRGWSPDSPLMATVSVDGRVATLADPPFYDPEGRRARA